MNLCRQGHQEIACRWFVTHFSASGDYKTLEISFGEVFFIHLLSSLESVVSKFFWRSTDASPKSDFFLSEFNVVHRGRCYRLVLESLLTLTFDCVFLVTEPEWELPHRGCYLPEWADTRPGSGKFDIVDIDPGLCTYICYAFAGIHGNILVVKPSDECT